MPTGKNGRSKTMFKRTRPTQYPDAWHFGPMPHPGMIVQYDQSLDGSRDYVSDNLTFENLATLLKAADSGDAAQMVQLSEEMESKDLRLKAVATTRRQSLTGMDWSIEPGEPQNDQTEKQAEMSADYVKGVWHRSPVFRAFLKHLAKAIGPNLSASEIVWQGYVPVDLKPVPSHRFNIDYTVSPDIRVVTDDNSYPGELTAPGKWIVHTPEGRSVWPFLNCIARAQALIYLIKHGAVADWAVFCEVYGMPVRIGTHTKNATDAEKRALEKALATMGSDAYAVISEAVSLDFKEVNRSSHPYGDCIEWAERNQAIGYLGQHLTTDTTGGTGTYAAAEIHNQVRRDILEDDISSEAEVIETQLFAPMVQFRWPNKGFPVPRFVRVFREQPDVERDLRIVTAMVRDLGLTVRRADIYEAAGIAEPEESDTVLTFGDLPKPIAPPMLPQGRNYPET